MVFLILLLLLSGSALVLSAVVRGARLRRQRRRFSDLPEVHWAKADESPLGRRVLDCRGYCRLMPDIVNDQVVARFRRTRRSSVAALCGLLPEGAARDGQAVNWRFSVGEMDRLRAGFHAAALPDRWHIRHIDGRLYFQRSWTGALVYVAQLDDDERGGRVVRLWFRRSDTDTQDQLALAVALVRYLIDSHLLGRPAAVPVPGDLAGDPQKMALFAFSIAGRQGEYAEPFWPDPANMN